MNPNDWATRFDLGTIATAMMIIAISYFLWVSRSPRRSGR